MTGAPYPRRVAVDAPPRPAPSATGTRAAALAGLGVWTALVGGAIAWGARVVEARPEMRISAAPFVGTWEGAVADEGALRVAVLLGALAVVLAPPLARRLPWRALVVGAGALAVAWLLALNAVDGPEALREPLTSRYEYVAGVPDVEAAGGAVGYLDTFTERIADYPTHVRGHPPGLVTGLWAADQVGLDPVDVDLVLVLAGWGGAPVAALVALRDVAGQPLARRSAPLVALAPGAVWAGTSPDAFFAGVTSAAVAALVLATGREGRRADVTAAAGGILVGVSMLLTYATGPVLAVPLAVALLRRRLRPLVVGGVAAVVVLLLAGLAGFWWPAGLLATRDEYHQGLSRLRPLSYFVVGNLAAVAVAVGPSLGAGLAGLVRRVRPGILVVGALVGVAAADLSGLSKGETERIWLVFVPWLAGTAAFLPGPSDRVHRGWVALQVAVGVGFQVALRTPW